VAGEEMKQRPELLW